MPARTIEPALTDKRLRSLACPVGKKFHDFRDSERRNFFVRVYPAGLKVFFYRYRSPYPKGAPVAERPVRTYRLGNYPAELGLAGVKAAMAKVDAMVAGGIDPMGAPQGDRKGLTLVALYGKRSVRLCG